MPVFAVSLIAALCGPTSPETRDAAADLVRVRAAEQARVEMVQRLMPAVVCVFPLGSHSGGGSGVVIDSEGYGLTNFHVVRGFAAERRGEGGLSDGKRYPLEVLGLDPTGDVAMFKLKRDKPFYVAPMGDSDALRVGDWTLAMGNPFLLAEEFQPTVTCGIVSGLHRYQRGEGRALVYTDCIQVDTSINPGNSGGPLFDCRGELVGINGRVSIEERGRVNVGVGYAITISQIRRFLPWLRAGLIVRHGMLGATVRDRSPDRVIVDQILTDGVAYQHGLRLADRIIRFGGVDVRSANHFMSLLGTYPAGWPVTIVHERDGKRLETRLRLAELPLDARLRPPKEMMERYHVKDPFRPNRKANERAARRALARYRRSIGRDEALEKIAAVHCVGSRRPREKAIAGAEQIEFVDSRRPAKSARADDPTEIERNLRWSLLAAPGKDKPIERVVGGDEINGRVATVLESGEDRSVRRIFVDDEDGRLLALEFQSADGKRIRYEYDDYRRAGAVRWPFRRRIFVDDKWVFDDEFEQVEPRG